MARDSYGVTRRRRDNTPAPSLNRPYDPARQVSIEDMGHARDVLARMLDGGELLTTIESPHLYHTILILEESITAAEKRAKKRTRGVTPLIDADRV